MRQYDTATWMIVSLLAERPKVGSPYDISASDRTDRQGCEKLGHLFRKKTGVNPKERYYRFSRMSISSILGFLLALLLQIRLCVDLGWSSFTTGTKVS